MTSTVEDWMSGPEDEPQGRSIWRSSGCALLALLIVLAAIAGAAVFGDGQAREWADREIERRLAEEGALDPQVDLLGSPFLTQVTSRVLEDVRLRATALPVEGGVLRSVNARLQEVDISDRELPVAGRLEASALVSYADVERAAGLRPGDLQREGDRLRIRKVVEAFGFQFEAAAIASVQISGRALRIVPERVELVTGPDLGSDLFDALTSALTVEVEVPELPVGLALDAIRPASTGFVVEVSGTDVPLTR